MASFRLLSMLLILIVVMCEYYNAHSKQEEDDNDSDDDDEGEKHPVDRLLDKILDEDVYDPRLRPPTFGQNGTKPPVIINVTFALYTFIDMIEPLEEGRAFMFLWERWWDPRLAWDPADYGGFDLITLETADIWFPDVYIYQLWTGQNDDKGSRTHARVRAVRQGDHFNAEVTLAYGALFIERCPMHMFYYPFDQQTCRFCMGSMASSNSQVLFQADPRVKDVQHATIGGEWVLVDVEAVDVIYREFSICCADITVKRRSTYFNINLFLPTIVACVLNTLGIFAKLEQSHHQLHIAELGQMSLLSLGVIMLTISFVETPKSATISIFGVFYIVMIFQTLTAVAMALYLRKKFDFTKHRVLSAIFRDIKEKLLNLGNRPRDRSFSNSLHIPDTTSNKPDLERVNQLIVVLRKEMKRNLVRWERICMWFHLTFIFLVAVGLTVVGITLSHQTTERHSNV